MSLDIKNINTFYELCHLLVTFLLLKTFATTGIKIDQILKKTKESF